MLIGIYKNLAWKDLKKILESLGHTVDWVQYQSMIVKKHDVLIDIGYHFSKSGDCYMIRIVTENMFNKLCDGICSRICHKCRKSMNNKINETILLSSNEIWLTEELEDTKYYYKYMFPKAIIKVIPFFTLNFDHILFDCFVPKSKKNVAIFNKNESVDDNFLWPLIACNKSEIDSCYVFNVPPSMKNLDFVKTYTKSLENLKNKLSFEGTHDPYVILQKYCNVAIIEGTEITQIHHICAYFGISLVHTCKRFKYGLYYEASDLELAAKHLRNNNVPKPLRISIKKDWVLKTIKSICLPSKIKIGITISNLESTMAKIFNNGLNQHIFMFYDWLYYQKGVEPYLISNKIPKKCKYRTINVVDGYNICKLDRIIHIGLEITKSIFEKQGYKWKKNVKYCMGNLDIELKNKLFKQTFSPNNGSPYVCGCKKNQFEQRDDIVRETFYDEVWISPHFGYAKHFFQQVYQAPVHVCPYFWTPQFINTLSYEPKGMMPTKLRVGIFEPNFYRYKSCFVPIIGCSFARQHVEEVYVFNGKKLEQFAQMKQFIKQSEVPIHLHDRAKITTDKIDVIVCYQEKCALNFMYLECFELGIPLIHNSRFMSGAGYYYETPEELSEQLGAIATCFNRAEYMEACKPTLQRYSLDHNVKSAEWFREKLCKKGTKKKTM